MKSGEIVVEKDKDGGWCAYQDWYLDNIEIRIQSGYTLAKQQSLTPVSINLSVKDFVALVNSGHIPGYPLLGLLVKTNMPEETPSYILCESDLKIDISGEPPAEEA